MTILNCVFLTHNIWLVLIAALICAGGSWTVIRLFYRASNTQGAQRLGWHFLTAVAAGAAIWCTHFVAMLAFDPGVPVGFDPILTILSLLMAMAGTFAGFLLAATSSTQPIPAIGGGLVGLTISAMHYVGMMAYRVQGIVSWDMVYLDASIVLSVVLSGLALHFAMRRAAEVDKYLATGLLALAITSLHFTGMTAFQVLPMRMDGSFSDPAALWTLAICVAGVALVVVGAGLASYLIDNSTRAASDEQLRYMALNDTLTGLPNRASFNARLDHELDFARRTGARIALIGIDLDRFKEINDLRGHAAGDEVLRVIAQRIANLLREGEFAARLGGDEFMAIHRLRDVTALEDFVKRLENAFSRPIQLDNVEIAPGASLGIAIYPDNGSDKATLISNADLAMYSAKSDIARAACFYDPSMGDLVRARRNLVGELRDALENNQLDIHYQVQTSVTTGEICGYEALLRWEHPQRGSIPPSEFIPLAEQNGLILQIGEWVLRTACAKAAVWEPQYKVAVNLSPIQLVHHDLPKLILEVLLDTGLSPERLELELTESTIFVDKDRSLHILRQIRALGVSIALDDFGTGYSSLETLRAFPFNKIKLDRSFMQEIECSPQAKAIIRAVLALGKSLDIPILAEGIETEGQFALLSAEGCDEAQGYLFGRPAPLHQIVSSGQLAMTDPHESGTLGDRSPAVPLISPGSGPSGQAAIQAADGEQVNGAAWHRLQTG
ncbi:bifunctional diguanylate cyclase/phosphodiesterase [Bradyrhizobium sp. SK17]|uniref:putative bifunctional diguanylate cyclase/phosphodiesterase n=1 Tax=Bradyrhizobium sp. SK17 TaxID=2057741 RepID=UPI000C3151C3|nr:bifunctional diguanylate cyclase/phosphodiesterase [Bradyrhizobium sp. SK17]AUC95259.1 bifunctional diguanylate cyclase/phosphodiesterase [Bradyrhizobium sp. SK17]